MFDGLFLDDVPKRKKQEERTCASSYASKVRARKRSKQEEHTCSSSYASKVQRDLYNWAFLNSTSQLKFDLNETMETVEEKGYNLEKLAETFDIPITESNSDNAAKELVTNLVLDLKVSVKVHPSLIFNGINVDDIVGCYDTQRNYSDVGVMEANNKSTVVSIEVNSSSMKETVIKTMHGIIQIVRIVKAHDVPNKEASLVGFALPKLGVKGMAVKVKVQYDTKYMGFDVSSKPLTRVEFCAELRKAITSNCEVLDKCKSSSLKSGYKGHVVSLNKDEMMCFGNSPKQHPAKFGVLFEVEKDGKTYYHKKPILSVSFHRMKSCVIDSYAIKYEKIDSLKKVVGYRKVRYNPLSYKEAEKCLKELLEEVFKACKTLSNHNTTHGDVRLPNICFNEEFKLVLIDFDISEEYQNVNLNLSVFVKDLKKGSGSSWMQTDPFLSKLCVQRTLRKVTHL